MSVLVRLCLFISVLFYFCPFLCVSVQLCWFRSISVLSCPFLSIYVSFYWFLSVLVLFCTRDSVSSVLVLLSSHIERFSVSHICMIFPELAHWANSVPLHRVLGPQLTLMKNSKWGRRHYNLVPEMQNFPIVTSCRLMTISVCRRLGSAWGVLGWVLDIKGRTERNLMLPLSEV